MPADNLPQLWLQCYTASEARTLAAHCLIVWTTIELETVSSREN